MTDTKTPIVEQLITYLRARLKLFLYEAIDQSSGFVAEMVTDLVLLTMILLTFFFLSIMPGSVCSASFSF